jgi:metal-responsive CopG/Arc/MetJ family transcriptional regulator
MQKVLIQFEEATLAAIDRIAPAAKRKRADFIRNAVKDAIFRHGQERMREAYRLQPDSAQDADSWDLPEEWKE